MMQSEQQEPQPHSQESPRPPVSRWRQLVGVVVVFAAGFAAALWLAVPPRSEAQGGGLGEIAGIELDRGGLHIDPLSGDSLLVVSTWIDGVPRSYPVEPGGKPTTIPPDDLGEEWGLVEIRFRPCRFGDCTDPVPPPDIFAQGGLLVWSPTDGRDLLCKSCILNNCCKDDR